MLPANARPVAGIVEPESSSGDHSRSRARPRRYSRSVRGLGEQLGPRRRGRACRRGRPSSAPGRRRSRRSRRRPGGPSACGHAAAPPVTSANAARPAASWRAGGRSATITPATSAAAPTSAMITPAPGDDGHERPTWRRPSRRSRARPATTRPSAATARATKAQRQCRHSASDREHRRDREHDPEHARRVEAADRAVGADRRRASAASAPTAAAGRARPGTEPPPISARKAIRALKWSSNSPAPGRRKPYGCGAIRRATIRLAPAADAPPAAGRAAHTPTYVSTTAPSLTRTRRSVPIASRKARSWETATIAPG